MTESKSEFYCVDGDTWTLHVVNGERAIRSEKFCVYFVIGNKTFTLDLCWKLKAAAELMNDIVDCRSRGCGSGATTK